MSAGHESAPAPREVGSTRLAASPTAAAGARAFVVTILRRWQVEPGALDDAELVVSELVTNAFLHGHAQEVAISLADHGGVVRLEVGHAEREPDPDPAASFAPLTVGARETHGRGLAIVDVLSSAWGFTERDGERRVWADLVAARAGLLPVANREEALATLAAAVQGPGAVGAVGHAVTTWARARLATSFCGVALVDGDDEHPDHLRYLSVEPLPSASAAAWTRFPVATDAPVAAAFREARPYFHESRNAAVAGFPDLGPALAEAQMVALAHLPLLDGGHPVGTLALGWSHGRELDAGDRNWLAAVAAVVAAAVVASRTGRRDDALADG